MKLMKLILIGFTTLCCKIPYVFHSRFPIFIRESQKNLESCILLGKESFDLPILDMDSNTQVSPLVSTKC